MMEKWFFKNGRFFKDAISLLNIHGIFFLNSFVILVTIFNLPKRDLIVQFFFTKSLVKQFEIQ